jgi:hypothetical protein
MSSLRTYLAGPLFLAVCFVAAGAEPTDVGPLIQRLKAVGKEGAGTTAAATALRELSRCQANVLPVVLAALDDATPEAANWLRSAVEAIADQNLAAGKPLPARDLERFVLETRHEPKARRLAFELLARVDASASDRLLPGMLQDPSLELRRDAVARLIQEAHAAKGKDDKEAARQAYERAFAGARDKDQIDLLAKELKALGAEVDIARHLGFVRSWQVLGPFDSTGGVGFAAVYDPERGVDLEKEFTGKGGAKLRWKPHVTADAYGTVDLNKAIGKHMGAAGYAYAVVESAEERPVEIRAGSNNAVKIWLNGKELVAHEEYHHGTRMDQYVGVGKLRPGKNELLIKVCQNEQKEEWAQSWGFQLRICDRVGTAVPVAVAEWSPAAKPTNGEKNP